MAPLPTSPTPARICTGSNEALQPQIVGAKLEAVFQRQIQTGHDRNEAVRRTATEWYSGDPDKANDSTRQSWGYESI
jgi:hypothetical protein